MEVQIPRPSAVSTFTRYIARLFAWQIQTATSGGLDAETERRLRDIAKVLERDGDYEPKIRRHVASGVVLTREWKGVITK